MLGNGKNTHLGKIADSGGSGCSSFVYGKSPESHLDHTIIAALGVKPVNLKGRKFVNTWRETLEVARSRTVAAQAKAKARLDSNRRLPAFDIGEQVLPSAAGFTAPHDHGMQYKMRAQWYGPFTVTGINMGSDDTTPPHPTSSSSLPSGASMKLLPPTSSCNGTLLDTDRAM